MSVDLKPGDRVLDRFRVEYLAAEGGMASIYAATDELTNHRVALKVLYPYYSDNAIIRARFVEEGRIQQQLRHPNIIRVFQIQDVPFLAILMEFVEGPTLDDFLADNGPLSAAQIVDVYIPMMSAVGFAHSQGVIHRDIKPSNILLPDGNLQAPKVLDFGVAKIKGGRHDLTATGTTVGTLHYMSPEQIVGSKSIDGRADIYSLGVMMYKLVTGEVPFNAPTEFALMMAQVEAPPLPPSEIQPGIDPALELIILKAMEKKPQDRFHTIRDFTQALLDLSVGTKSTVADTVNGRISSELLSYAINADEIAVDRTSDDTFGRTERIEAVALPLDQATMEIEATLKIERTDLTSELSNSSIVRISNASLALRDESLETEAIPNLRERLKKQNQDVTRLTPSSEIQELLHSSQSQESIHSRLSSVETVDIVAPSRQTVDLQTPGRRQTSGREPLERQPSARHPLERQPSARHPLERQPSGRQPARNPSGRNPIESGDDLNQNTYELPAQDLGSLIPTDPQRQPMSLGLGTQPVEPEDFETVSVARPIKAEELKALQRGGGLRSGVLVADPHLDSRDLTAPKLSREQLLSYLPPSEQPQPVQVAPQAPPPQPSGPKLVLGKNYADTSERTREKPPSILEQDLINNAPPPMRSGYQASPGNPLEDGRQHQRAERNIGPTVPANEMQSMLASNLPRPLNQPPEATQASQPEINKVWFLILLVAVGIIVLVALILVARLS